MNIIPTPKQVELSDNFVNLSEIEWIFSDSLDERVRSEAIFIRPSTDGFPVYINAADGDCEAYVLDITPNEVIISSNGANGAFYALQTLKQLLNENNGTVRCQKITDAPDMKYRGFYHDVSRGKVPTLETLKALVDKIAGYKLNSLQLYIEHTFEFKEYEFCRDRLGYLTKDEIRELDAYCRSKFIELIPSVSCFGHLYHLLQEGDYSHLCELSGYTPDSHYWWERMKHHTINPLSGESFEVIKSIIDQYLEVSTSDKFNICCDETFDLGTDVNAGKNKAELYVGFTKKIIEYLTSKGKQVMMWGDIILQHPEYLSELPDNIVFLNWNYEQTPPEEPVKKIYESGRKQILCPCTSSWSAFSEDIVTEEGNIAEMAHYARKYGAAGLLNTNWGDLGNPASITSAAYGIALGAAISWNSSIRVNGELRKSVSEYVFGNDKVIDIIAEISEMRPLLDWNRAIIGKETSKYTEEDFKNACNKLQNIRNSLEALTFNSDIEKREVLLAVDGYIITAAMCAATDGFNMKTETDYEKWFNELSELWLIRNKKSELPEMLRVIKERLYAV